MNQSPLLAGFGAMIRGKPCSSRTSRWPTIDSSPDRAAGCGDHHLRLDQSSIDERYAGGVNGRDGLDHLDLAVPDRVDHIHVDDGRRDGAPVSCGEGTLLRHGQPEFGEIAETKRPQN